MNETETWIEVTIPSSPESFEAVENFLFEQGSCGTEEKQDAITGYFLRNLFLANLKDRLAVYLQGLRALGFVVGHPSFREIPSQDWGRRWRRYFKPIEVTPSIVIKPPWKPWKGRPGQIVIDIMPRMAFGTGTHETTQVAVELLEAHLRPSDVVLDVGTGSGILAIAAAKLGAARVLAVDIETESVENARENAAQNDVVDKVTIRHGSVEAVGPETFDVVLANINREALMAFLPRLKRHVVSSSRLILSGLLRTEKARMDEILSTSKYRTVEIKTKSEWMGYVVRPS